MLPLCSSGKIYMQWRNPTNHNHFNKRKTIQPIRIVAVTKVKKVKQWKVSRKTSTCTDNVDSTASLSQHFWVVVRALITAIVLMPRSDWLAGYWRMRESSDVRSHPYHYRCVLIPAVAAPAHTHQPPSILCSSTVGQRCLHIYIALLGSTRRYVYLQGYLVQYLAHPDLPTLLN